MTVADQPYAFWQIAQRWAAIRATPDACRPRGQASTSVASICSATAPDRPGSPDLASTPSTRRCHCPRLAGKLRCQGEVFVDDLHGDGRESPSLLRPNFGTKYRLLGTQFHSVFRD